MGRGDTPKDEEEIERLVRGMQRLWLLRGAIRQADADVAVTNKTQPREEAVKHEGLDQFSASLSHHRRWGSTP